MELSQYLLEALRRDEEFVLYRGAPSKEPGSPSVLLLAPASMQPALETQKRLEYEHSLRDELDSAWAIRSLALSEKDELRRNQFGGTFGGPIIKDKTFLFFNYEGLRLRQGQTQIATVPSDPQRTANFGTQGTVTNIDPTAAALLPLIPRANVGTNACLRADPGRSVAPSVF